MTITFGRSALFIASCMIIMPMAQAQDFFRDLGTSRSSGGIGPVVPSDYSYQDASPSGLRPLRPGQDLSATEEQLETDRYNFALGGFRFGMALGVGFEYNDNITLSQHDRISDVIFRPVLNIDSEWRISDLNTLRFNVGISYAEYFNHPAFNPRGPLISPNSELALTVYTGSIKWTMRDRLSYQEDTYDVPQVSNTTSPYARWENQAGLEGVWQMNQAVDLTAAYDHYDLWTTNHGNPEYALQDRAIDTIQLKPGWKVNPAIKVGVNGSYSFIRFKDDARSNQQSLLVGPFVEWQISDFTNLYLEGGYQNLITKGASDYSAAAGLTPAEAAAVGSTTVDDSSSHSYYIKFEIDNRPMEFFRHRLSFSKTAEVGFTSNYIDLYNVEYDADWKLTEKLDVGPTIFYEHYDASGPDGERADRVGAALGLRYHLTNSLTLGLDYRYIWKHSNLPDLSYYQDLVFASVYYKF